jgi:hypothetical protein
MKNWLWRGMLAAAIVLPALSDSTAQGQQGREQRGIGGVWEVSITIVSCTTGAPSLTVPHANISMFNDGGTLTAVFLSANDPFSGSANRSPTLGTWRHVGGSSYTSRETGNEYTAAGAFNGTVVVTREIELAKDADEYTNTAISEFYNAAGQLINTVCATGTATRFE